MKELIFLFSELGSWAKSCTGLNRFEWRRRKRSFFICAENPDHGHERMFFQAGIWALKAHEAKKPLVREFPNMDTFNIMAWK